MNTEKLAKFATRYRLQVRSGPAARVVIAGGCASGLLPLLLVCAGVSPAAAQVTGAADLNTLVRCVVGLCSVSGGAQGGGANMFYGFEQFNTSNGIRAVSIANPSAIPNVVAAVRSPMVLTAPLVLANPANLFVLSPRGITVNGAGTFGNVNSLVLSTSSQWGLGAATFDVFATTAAQIRSTAAFGSAPEPTVAGLLATNLGEGTRAGFFLSPGRSDDSQSPVTLGPGVSLSVDGSLLVVANKAPVTISGSSLSAAGQAVGDGLAVVGQNVTIRSSTLASNRSITLREPQSLPFETPSLALPFGRITGDITTFTPPPDGMLASGVVSSNCATAGSQVACSSLGQTTRYDTLSNMLLQDVLLTDAGSPAADWTATLRVIGWGCRDNGGQVCGNQGVPGPNVVGPNGQVYSAIGPTSPSGIIPGTNPPQNLPNPGRVAYSGLQIDNVRIAPREGVATLNFNLLMDWGTATNLQVTTPSGSLPVVQFREAASGSSLGQGWGIGGPLTSAVAYQGNWWDGGAATGNNISLSQSPVPVSVPGVTATVISFDQALVNLDQTVIEDAEFAALNSSSQSPQGQTSLDVSMGEPAPLEEVESDQPSGQPGQ